MTDGIAYEYECANILKARGFHNVQVTQASGDQGLDVIAYKDGRKYGIQCKLYSHPVGNFAVQEAYSGAKFYNCDEAAVMTNNTFTRSAKELADRTGVILWDNCRPIINNYNYNKQFLHEKNPIKRAVQRTFNPFTYSWMLLKIFGVLNLILGVLLILMSSRPHVSPQNPIIIYLNVIECISIIICGVCGIMNDRYVADIIGTVFCVLTAIMIGTSSIGFTVFWLVGAIMFFIQIFHARSNPWRMKTE